MEGKKEGGKKTFLSTVTNSLVYGLEIVDNISHSMVIGEKWTSILGAANEQFSEVVG